MDKLITVFISALYAGFGGDPVKTLLAALCIMVFVLILYLGRHK